MIDTKELNKAMDDDPPDFTDHLYDGVCEFLCHNCPAQYRDPYTGQWECDVGFDPAHEDCVRNAFFTSAGAEIVKFNMVLNEILEEAKDYPPCRLP